MISEYFRLDVHVTAL